MRSVVLVMMMLVAGCAPPSIGSYPEGNDVKLPKETDPDAEEKGGAHSPPAKQKLTVTLSGAGKGAVSSAPSGVTCSGTTCSGTFDKGAAITLTATPEAGSVFKGWAGSCNGSDSCSPFLDSDINVTAEFVTLDGAWTDTHSLTVSGCTFNNAGSLTVNLTTGASPTSSMEGTGFQVKELRTCQEVQPSPRQGTATATSVTLAENTVTGTWTIVIPGTSGPLPLPFTATIAGSKMTGKWTCTGCTGEFTLTKQ